MKGRLSSLTILIVLVALVCLSSFKVTFVPGFALGCLNSEREALLKLKHSLSDPANRLSSWEGDNCCHWAGVSCNNVTGHVHGLDLHASELTVESLDWVSGVLKLQSLDMSGVNLINAQESLQSLSKLPNLLDLRLHSCFDGNTSYLSHAFLNSTWLITTLEHLDLSSNSFRGPLPRFLSNMTSLRFLDLSWNDFKGSVPLWLSNMRSLESMCLSYNHFSHIEGGTVMGIMGNPCKFKVLDLSLNHYSHGGKNYSLQGELVGTHDNFSRCIAYDLESLDLRGNGLTGTLPHWLGNLTNLKYFYLSGNMFQGPIPSSLGSLSSLKILGLSQLSLEGVLSDMHLVNLSSLEQLDFSNTPLKLNTTLDFRPPFQLSELLLKSSKTEGQIPRWIGTQSELIRLDMSDNFLSGQIPDSLGQCSKLEFLDLSNNLLNGRIPESLGQCNKLSNIDLSSNLLERLESSYPFANLSDLRSLDLSDNHLKGQIPELLGQCNKLYYLNLSSNFFNSMVSNYHLANLSSLGVIDLSYNTLSFSFTPDWIPPFQLEQFITKSCGIQGELPLWIQTQKYISELDLSNNMISGKMLDWSSNGYLGSIDLSHNSIVGPITHFPYGIESMDLSYNFLSGPLLQDLFHSSGAGPTSLCQLTQLMFLNVQNNKLFGTIPYDCWTNASDLYAINLSFNNLSGAIPMAIGLLSNLIFLNLNNNSLEGKVPPLTACGKLQILDLGENKLSGEIPSFGVESHPYLQILRLRANRLTGGIPPEFCSLTHLQILDLAGNNLSGIIPRCFGHFNDMSSLASASPPAASSELENAFISFLNSYKEITMEVMEVLKGEELQYTRTLSFVKNLDLSCNRLFGSIPEELTNLSGLIGLNLSYNYLTGRIPEKIGEMRSLESLDLSNNNLSGTIPSSMSAIPFLSYLNLSCNMLYGKIPTGPQLQTLDDPSIYADNLGLCGKPLPNKCTSDQGQHQGQEREPKEEEDPREKVLFYLVVALGFGTGFWGVVGTLLLKKQWRYALFRRVEDLTDYCYIRVVVMINRMRQEL